MALMPGTAQAYAADWRAFCHWCQGRHLAALPAQPSTVAAYLVDLSVTRKLATITRHLTSA
jgi:hypothetical protein